MVQYGSVWLSMVQYGLFSMVYLVWFSMVQYGSVWLSMVEYGLVWFSIGSVWFSIGFVWFGMV